MAISSRDQLSQLTAIERLRSMRNGCIVLGIVVLALALMCMPNNFVNPKIWSSAFYALAVTGEFVKYMGWLAVGGGLFLALALLITLYIRGVER